MDKQVFQTDSTSRWRRFKWGVRLFLFFLLLCAAVFGAMFAINDAPSLPFKRDYGSAVTAQRPYLRDNSLSKEYKGFRDYFSSPHPHSNYVAEADKKLRFKGRGDSLTHKYIATWTDRPAGLRAAYYVNWDEQSYLSLKQHLRHLNLVIPEWFFINPQTGRLEVQTDPKALALLRRTGMPVMPMLTNNYGGQFRPEPIGGILRSPERRRAFINELLEACVRNRFAGVNLDLEELDLQSDEELTSFVEEVVRVFHARGLYVTQDIMAFNADYNVEKLAQLVDYVFVMAYDEHAELTAPGPVSSQKWVESVVDQVARRVPNDKLVLGLAAYGYDWTADGRDNQSVSYHQAVAEAAAAGAQLLFDDDTYNLSFGYKDEDGMGHQVYLADAVTNWNMMRFGTVYGLAGFGVWRLGTEDPRLWHFYGRDLSNAAAARFDFGKLEHMTGQSTVNYLGEGEVLKAAGTPQPGSARLEIDRSTWLISHEQYGDLPSGYRLQRYGGAGPKELLLTFDDGPSARYTPQVLRILRERGVKAAFFMVGLQMEKNLPLVRQVYDEGHLIGNHTFTHHNVAENSPARTFAELKLTRMLTECVTGHSTVLFRAPYNADSDPTGYDEIIPLVLAGERNYVDVGESIDPNDWQPGVTADEIYSRVMRGVEAGNGHIILLHDAGGETRRATVEALPRIIDTLQARGYRFIGLDRYLGKPKASLMPPVPKGKAYYIMQGNLFLAEGIYAVSDFVAAVFVVFMLLGFGRLAFMYYLALRERRREKGLGLESMALPADAPKVSVIVPAYNEEVGAVAALHNLLRQDYPHFDVIFVDDGSKDQTLERVREAFENDVRVKVLTKPNGGKASALNYGIAHSEADFVVCMDADTQLRPDAVSQLMRHFLVDKDKRVGAVAGYVKVGNECNMLTRWQAIEYTTSQNFDRMASAAINAITVVPGAVGAFRKEAVAAAGGLTTDTLAEDCDLTIRVIKAGYRVENESRAVALTEAPETLRQFVKQRVRWSFGVMQTFWKHRRVIFDRRYKGLGLWAFPNMLLFQFVIPTFSPIADVLMLLGLFTGNAGPILIYYALFLLVDASVSVMAYLFERERLWVLLWIVPQRFVYRWIMYYVLFRSYLKAIKGELQTWGVLKRTGDVRA